MPTRYFASIVSKADREAVVRAAPAALVLYSAPDCQLCRALEPKLSAALETEFPRLERYSIDCRRYPELAAQEGVFSVPTLVLYLEGREWWRQVRPLSVSLLIEAIRRPYQMTLASE